MTGSDCFEDDGDTVRYTDVVWDPERLTISDLHDIYQADVFSEMATLDWDVAWSLDGFQSLPLKNHQCEELEAIAKEICEKRGEGAIRIIDSIV